MFQLLRLSSFLLLFISTICFAEITANSPMLRLHGSNTIGAELAPELVKAWLSNQGYHDIRVQLIRDEEKLIRARDSQGVEKTVEISSHGSSTGFRSLENELADIAMSSRPIKEKENNRLKAYGEMTRQQAEHVVGLDGIAVIVNKINPIVALDKADIRKIFSGEYTRWSQINRDMSGDIHVYARDNNSGTYDTFKALILDKKHPLVKTAKRYESNAHLSDDVSNDLLAIGFVGLPYVRNSKALAVSEEGAHEKYPTEFDVATEDYALSRRLYLYVTKPDELTTSFVEFCMSERGQSIVEAVGFVSQNIKAKKINANPSYPDEYLQFTEGASRLSVNVRFRKGSTKIENKSMRDVQRLIDFMKLPENLNRGVMLFGFAEKTESSPVFSIDLSTYRVDWVSDLLIQNGIDPVRVRSYGAAIPVASHEDAGGRHKNRRVEVWITQ